MIVNDEIFIVVQSISNTVNSISELDALIAKEKSQSRINELKKRQSQLIEILRKMAQELDERHRAKNISLMGHLEQKNSLGRSGSG